MEENRKYKVSFLKELKKCGESIYIYGTESNKVGQQGRKAKEISMPYAHFLEPPKRFPFLGMKFLFLQ